MPKKRSLRKPAAKKTIRPTRKIAKTARKRTAKKAAKKVGGKTIESPVSYTMLHESLKGKAVWKGPQLPERFSKKARWNPSKGITYSALSNFLICPQSFHRSNVVGLRKKDSDDALDFGNLFHDLSETFFGLTPSRSEIKRHAYDRLEPMRSKALMPEDQTYLNRLCEITSMIFFRHQKHWAENPTYSTTAFPADSPARKKGPYVGGVYDSQFDVLMREKSFLIEHEFAPNRVQPLRGKIDGVFKVPVLNEIAVLENKTKGNIDLEGIESTLHQDLQTQIYLYACRRMGFPATRVLYNLVRRPKHRFNSSKETLEDFVDRIEQDVDKDPWKYFQRLDRPVAESQMRQFIEYSLNPLLWRLVQWWDSIAEDPFDPYRTTDPETQEKTINPHHFERPFGVYDPYAFSAKGYQYDLRIRGDYSGYRQIDESELFPELDALEDSEIVRL